MNPQTVKSGVYTSEFWLTVAHQVIAALLLVHVLPASDANMLNTSLTALIPAIFIVATQGASVVAYIWSRVQVKNSVVVTPAPVVPVLPTVVPVPVVPAPVAPAPVVPVVVPPSPIHSAEVMHG